MWVGFGFRVLGGRFRVRFGSNCSRIPYIGHKDDRKSSRPKVATKTKRRRRRRSTRKGRGGAGGAADEKGVPC